MYQRITKPALAACLFGWSMLLWLGGAVAAESAVIELVDGSTVRGEVLSLKGGAYEVKSKSLGVVRIPQNDVALVSYADAKISAAAAVPSNSANVELLSSLQTQLSQNPETLQLIMGLGEDPTMQAVIHDPEIQAAIRSGNFESLMTHPKIKALMAHPTIRKITADSAR
ncbi:MAG: hypothetical protein ACR2PZ_17290 [Pseudomonadales bacterium]